MPNEDITERGSVFPSYLSQAKESYSFSLSRQHTRRKAQKTPDLHSSLITSSTKSTDDLSSSEDLKNILSVSGRTLTNNEFVLVCDDNFKILACSESLLRTLGLPDLSVRGQDVAVLVPKLNDYSFYKQQRRLRSLFAQKETVVVCGKIINLTASTGLKSFSVWIKLHYDAPHKNWRYLWVLQPIDDNQVLCVLDDYDCIAEIQPQQGSLAPAIANSFRAIIGKHFSRLFASCSTIQTSTKRAEWNEYLQRKRYQCIVSESGTVVPVRITAVSQSSFLVSCLSILSGLVVVDAVTLCIKSFNFSFLKQLAGYANCACPNSLENQRIELLLPDFEQMLMSCHIIEKRHSAGPSTPKNFSSEGFDEENVHESHVASPIASPVTFAPYMGHMFPTTASLNIPNSPFRSLSRVTTPKSPGLVKRSSTGSIFLSSEDASLVKKTPVFTVHSVNLKHRDGSLLPIQLQILEQYMEQGKKGWRKYYLLWISFKLDFAPSCCTTPSPIAASLASPGSPYPLIPSPELKTRQLEDFEFIEELGNGSYGQVQLARCVRGKFIGKLVVIKNIIKSRILISSWTRDAPLGLMPTEIHVLNKIRRLRRTSEAPDGCYFICHMLDFFEDEVYFYVLTEHRRGTDLYEYVMAHGALESPFAVRVMLQLCKAVSVLHGLDIVHRDIKAENVLVAENSTLGKHAVLIDFGSAAYCKDTLFDLFCGTAEYAAPEILNGNRYEGKSQDMWSIGVLFYFILFGQTPFSSVEAVLTEEANYPVQIEPSCSSLLLGLLERDLSKRLTIEQALEHEYFKEQ